ncbi:MAG: twin-arginine translocase TatA/TatE family subunit [Parachlamydia sp.]|nr:MAG: twin-arginine translocase TatA/TatE family subunit [Parachlamydia sp.]
MFGTGEIIVIFCVILLLFGGKRLPELARSLGKGIREFKKACESDEPASTDEQVEAPAMKPPKTHESE